MSIVKFWQSMDTLHKVVLVAALASVFCTVCADCTVCKYYWPLSFKVRNPLAMLEPFDAAPAPPAPQVRLVLYTASWCPYCQKLEQSGEWDKTKQALAGTPIRVVKYDADADAEQVKAAAVDSFPTIVLYKDGNAAKYEGERTADSIVKFVQMQ